jgi:hypothetical protein
MAWLTTYTDANKVVDSLGTAFQTVTIYTWVWTDEEAGIGEYVTSEQSFPVNIESFRYVGMDYSTAVTCRTAMLAVAGVTFAELVRENEAGAYTVRVNKQTAYT